MEPTKQEVDMSAKRGILCTGSLQHTAHPWGWPVPGGNESFQGCAVQTKGQKMQSFNLAAEARNFGQGGSSSAGRVTSRVQGKPAPERRRGKVKWYDPDKGYGFIQLDGGGKDVFVHAHAVKKSGLAELSEGERLEFEVEQGRKGLQAVNLKPVG